ncbi:MAG: fused MFS/spermidine synthase [Candidatus Brocadiaceae bacterium]|nr:fused MFS/spermidine synthase [Candidatus Brocadiaceae bacterium]
MARESRRSALLALAALLAVATAAHAVRAQTRGRLVHQQNTLYHRVYVYQAGSVFALEFGRQRAASVQSRVDVANLRRHMLEYSVLTFSGLLYQPEPERILVLGLGGGTIPRELHHHFPDAAIDVAEIDPDVPPIAQRYFAFRPDERLRVHVADGRLFIRNRARATPVERYDLIILDAFNSDYIPFHLMTREFLEEVKGVLAEDGAVVANVFWNNRLFDAELKTFEAVFRRCQVFVGQQSGNAMIVSPGPKAPTFTPEQAHARAAELQARHRFDFDLRWVAGRLNPDVRPDGRARVLTDDRAPVNWLREQETSRR